MGTLKTPRIPEIDSLRAVAALGVMAFHYTSQYQALWGHPTALPFMLPGGFFGVYLFFMISGLVIFQSLNATSSSAAFAWNRFSRLYPVYWVAVLFTSALMWWNPLPTFPALGIQEILANLTMLQGFANIPSADGVYWTLKIELTFYVLMTLLWFGLPRAWFWPLLMAWLTGGYLVSGFLASPFLPSLHPWAGKIQTLTCSTYAPFFITGIVLSETHKKGPTPFRLAALALALAHPLVFGREGGAPYILGSASLLAAALWGKAPFLKNPALLFLGGVSYSFYLVHQNLSYVMIRKTYAHGFGAPEAFTLAFVASLLVAIGLTYTIEKPSLSFLRKHNPLTMHLLPKKKGNNINLRTLFPPFVRYTAIVGMGFSLDFLTFLFAHHVLNISIVWANIMGGIVGVTFAYFMAVKHVFEYKGHMLWPKLGAYLAYQMVAVAGFSWLIQALANSTGIPGAAVKLAVVPVQFITNYLILKNLLSWFERRATQV